MILSRHTATIALLAYMSVIFFLSHIPSGTESQLDLVNFKWLSQELGNLLHIPMYGVLAYLWFQFFKGYALTEAKMKTAVITLSVLYAISDEFHQYFIPGRYASFSDLILDLIGIIIVVKYYSVIDKLMLFIFQKN